MEFLDIGDKIKKVRKELNIKQRELEDVNMTRSLVSMIEIGKRTPNKENMDNIIEKFKKRAKELNVPFNLDVSYFLRSAKDDAKIYCIESLSCSNYICEITNVIEIASKYKLSGILSDAYLKLADKRFIELDYINSQVNYINALEICKDINKHDKIPYIYNMLGKCCINQTQNIQALNYFNYAYHYSILYQDEEIKKTAIYNIALCYKKLGRIEDVLKYIDIYNSTCDKKKDFLVYSYANILRANCYDCKEDVNKGIEILNELLNEFNDKEHILIGNIYNNLGVLYCKQGQFEKSQQCFNLSLDIRIQKDNQNLSHTLLEKSLLYTQQGFYMDSISIIKSAIELATKYNDLEYILKGYYELVKIYKILKLDIEIQDNYINIINLLIKIGTKDHKDEIVKIGIELVRIYLSKNDIQKSMNILEIIEKTCGN